MLTSRCTAIKRRSVQTEFLRQMALKIAAGRAHHILILEAADASEPRRAKPIEKDCEIRVRLAGKADDERRSQPEIRQAARQRSIRSRVFSWFAGRRIAFSTCGEACWKGMSR